MAGTLKKVRIIRAWKNYRVGAELTPNGTVRDYLVNQGYAEIVEAETPARPGKLVGKALRKVTDGARAMLKA